MESGWGGRGDAGWGVERASPSRRRRAEEGGVGWREKRGAEVELLDVARLSLSLSMNLSFSVPPSVRLRWSIERGRSRGRRVLSKRYDDDNDDDNEDDNNDDDDENYDDDDDNDEDDEDVEAVKGTKNGRHGRGAMRA